MNQRVTRPTSRLCVVIAFALLSTSTLGQAQRPIARGAIHTDTLWAQSLGARKALTVYLPPSYRTATSRRFPVLIYLHGLYGNERNWTESGALNHTLDSLAAAGRGEAIVVMPDGDDGWYTTWNSLAVTPPCASDTVRKEPATSYCVPWTHYDDYIARDIVAHVDARYRTIPDRGHRGIAGLSMGGYGAMMLALSYPTVFGAAASHSGVLSPRLLAPKPYPKFATSGVVSVYGPTYARDSIELKAASTWLWKSLAPAFGHDTIGWIARDPGRVATRLAAKHATSGTPVPALFFDCGTEDGFLDQNRDFDATLRRLQLSHEYAEWPGKHEWVYWRTHSADGLRFLLARTAR